MFLNKTIYKTKYYYSFEDILYYTNVHRIGEYTYQYISQTASNMVTNFERFVSSASNTAFPYARYSFLNSTGLNDVFVEELYTLMMSRYHKWIALVSEEDLKEQPLIVSMNKYTSPVVEFIFKFFNLTQETYERYEVLLRAYRSNEAKILASLGDVENIDTEAHSQSKFNDTPQLAEGTNDYTGDGYISNLTLGDSEGSTERTLYTDVMERLKQIRKQYKNVMEEWAKEFEVFFIPLSNYQ